MKKETVLSAIIIGLILVFMVWMIPAKIVEPEYMECEVQTIPVTHRTVFYLACGQTSWDGKEWREPTMMELRRIEKWVKQQEKKD